MTGLATADVRLTAHGFVKPHADLRNDNSRDVCVFCHTPESGTTRASPPSPQWQSSLDPGHVFTIYDDIGRLGLDRIAIGSQSIACLSCHDANQALAVSRTSADHPFGVPYRGFLKNLSPLVQQAIARSQDGGNTPRIVSKKLLAFDDFRDASHGVIENRSVWWVSRAGITASRSRGDLPLYARLDQRTGEELPHIECTSCHDPHSPSEQFLRVPNVDSALCLTCHNK